MGTDNHTDLARRLIKVAGTPYALAAALIRLLLDDDVRAKMTG